MQHFDLRAAETDFAYKLKQLEIRLAFYEEYQYQKDKDGSKRIYMTGITIRNEVLEHARRHVFNNLNMYPVTKKYVDDKRFFILPSTGNLLARVVELLEHQSKSVPVTPWIIVIPSTVDPSALLADPTLLKMTTQAFPQASTLSALKTWVWEHDKSLQRAVDNPAMLKVYKPAGDGKTWEEVTGPGSTPLDSTTEGMPYHVQASK